MKWLPGGWDRADVERQRPTTPATADPTVVEPGGPRRPARQEPAPGSRRGGMLSPDAQDVDVSAGSFRNLLLGGGISGFFTVLFAAGLVDNPSGAGLWLGQIVAVMLFALFVRSAGGMLRSRGFLFDRSAFYARTQGEVFGVAWEEISAVGVGSLPWVQYRKPVSPERRHAVELYPADPGFPRRHPELERFLVEEPAPMPGLADIRYRFHLPPMTRVPRRVEHAVQTVAPRKWIGRYRRQLPPPPTA
jgi:hypothetical protein